MRRVQFGVGVTVVLAFLASGAYMHLALRHLRDMSLAQRMVYRASHINLLLFGAVNIAASGGAEPSGSTPRRMWQVARVLSVLAALLSVVAFITEPTYLNLFRPWTRLAVYSIAGSIVLWVGVALVTPKSRPEPVRRPLHRDDEGPHREDRGLSSR